MAENNNLVVSFIRSALFDSEISSEIVEKVRNLGSDDFSIFLSDIGLRETCTRENFVEKFQEDLSIITNLKILIDQNDHEGIVKYFSTTTMSQIVKIDIAHSLTITTFEKCSMECFGVLIGFITPCTSQLFCDFVLYTAAHHNNPMWEMKVRAFASLIGGYQAAYTAFEYSKTVCELEPYHREASRKLMTIVGF